MNDERWASFDQLSRAIDEQYDRDIDAANAAYQEAIERAKQSRRRAVANLTQTVGA